MNIGDRVVKISREKPVPAGPADLGGSSGYAKGVLCCIVAALLSGSMFPVMTGALTHTDPFTFTSLRYVIAGSAS